MTQTTGTTPQSAAGTGTITHTEFASDNVDATLEFLKKTFGWQFEDSGNAATGAYHTFGSAEGVGGAVRAVMTENNETPGATPYVSVDDLDATIATAQQAGAQVIVPKMPVQDMGWFAWFAAPGGIVVAAWQDDKDAPAQA